MEKKYIDDVAKKWKESLSSDNTIGKYKVDRLIAFGGFGCVRMCSTPNGNMKVAVKTFIMQRMKENDNENMKREIAVLRRARHPNIIELQEVIQAHDCVHVVIEYASGGDLFTQVKRHGAVGEPEASRILLQLLLAVDYLHTQLKVCHRDIKLENILFTDFRSRKIKLIDFNLSSTFDGSSQCMVNTARGTPAYSAPEVIRCMEHAGLSEDTQLVIERADSTEDFNDTDNNSTLIPTTTTTTATMSSSSSNKFPTASITKNVEKRLPTSSPSTTTKTATTGTNTTAVAAASSSSSPPPPPSSSSSSSSSQSPKPSKLPTAVSSGSRSRKEDDTNSNPKSKVSEPSLLPHTSAATSRNGGGEGSVNNKAAGQEGKWYDACPADVWSCGVVLYVMVYGYLPFYEHSVRELCTSIKRGLPPRLPAPASKEVRHLIRNMLHVDAKKRFTIAEAKDHVWVRARFHPPTPELLPTSSSASFSQIPKSVDAIIGGGGGAGRRASTRVAVNPSPTMSPITISGSRSSISARSKFTFTGGEGGKPKTTEGTKSWYEKLHGGEISSHLAEEEDEAELKSVHPSPQNSGMSGDSWKLARDEALVARSSAHSTGDKTTTNADERKGVGNYSNSRTGNDGRITTDMLLQHIDEEDEEAVEEEEEDGMGWYYG
eukprot:jgi/Bigna1/135648/aug1.30_g10356